MFLKVRFISFLIVAVTFCTTLQAAQPNQPRHRESLNGGWKFSLGDLPGAEQPEFNDAAWPRLDLPHTWNIDDTLDDAPGYHMGTGWYRKVIDLHQRLRGKRLFLYFEGANQKADVFVNGKLAGRHQGGYTAFVFDITAFVSFEAPNNRNLIAVKVDNRVDPDVPPSPAADFNLYGGIYRDVWLVATDPVHFKMLDYASPGVYIDTPTVSAARATVRVRGTITNSSDQPRQLRVLNRVVDATSRVVEVESTVSVPAGGEAAFQQLTAPVQAPRLWSPETPHLYSLETRLYDGDRLLDQVTNPLGFRWFSFDANQGFFLNGKPYKLRGTNRHQDYAGLGNAVPNELQVKDLETIKELGLNCVLLAHYPHDPVVLETADRLGLIVWEELPLVREISTSKQFADNSKEMLTEMIRQHYNHPSIIMWCLMNEIFLKLRTETGYVRQVVQLARTLDELARQEDPTRVTVISANRPYDDTDIYNASGLLNIPQVVGWHMYFGWYYGEFDGVGKFLDDEHRRFPKRVLFVSEYGADTDIRVHALSPRRGDSSTEWARLYHESYLKQIEERSYLGGSAVWAQHDFGSEARGESRPHINTKGLTTFDRRPKDIYYFYKANFSKAPVLRIATHDWVNRSGAGVNASGSNTKHTVSQTIVVYANLAEVELFLNRRSLGAKIVGPARRVEWEVSFANGPNLLEARGLSGRQQLADRVIVRFAYRPSVLADPLFPVSQLAVNVGSTAQYVDGSGVVWEADQAYTLGSWGCSGGTLSKTNRNIKRSEDDPLYQSARQGVSFCRFDVPDGKYEVELRFVDHSSRKPGEQVFNVSINGKRVITNLDLFGEHGDALVAEARVLPVNATRKQGVTVEFSASTGAATLSGISIRRLK